MSKILRLVSLFLAFAFGVIGLAVAINAQVKFNDEKDMLATLVPKGITLDIGVHDTHTTGIIIAVVSALIAIVSLASLIFTAFLPRLNAKTSKINSILLAFLSVWLLATLIPFTLFFATRYAHVRAFIGSQELPESVVQATQQSLAVSNKYSDKDYLKLVAILPWFTFLFGAIASAVTFRTPKKDLDYAT